MLLEEGIEVFHELGAVVPEQVADGYGERVVRGFRACAAWRLLPEVLAQAKATREKGLMKVKRTRTTVSQANSSRGAACLVGRGHRAGWDNGALIRPMVETLAEEGLSTTHRGCLPRFGCSSRSRRISDTSWGDQVGWRQRLGVRLAGLKAAGLS